jgi:hypothetical protein
MDTFRLSALGRRFWRTFLLYRGEAIRAREAAAAAESSTRAQSARSLYARPRVAHREIEALSTFDQRAFEVATRRRYAPLRVATLALATVLAVIVVLLAPSIV